MNLGEDWQSDNDLATIVLVFMAVAVNSSWKIPIAYFFVNNLSALEKVGILLQVIIKVVNSLLISYTRLQILCKIFRFWIA